MPDGGFVDLAVRYLARSDRSNAEITDYLIRRGASRTIAAATVRRLERLGYLNEAAHAMRWSERRLAGKPMGRLRMREELLRRGFPATVTADTVEKLYGTIDEAELAIQALALRGGRHTVPQDGRFLEGRGFSQATITRVLDIEPAGY
jgi:regulatory protein